MFLFNRCYFFKYEIKLNERKWSNGNEKNQPDILPMRPHLEKCQDPKDRDYESSNRAIKQSQRTYTESVYLLKKENTSSSSV